MALQALLSGLPAVLENAPVGVENENDYLNAAVTVPLVEVDGNPAVLFEVRSRFLSWQPSEICFPGGRIEPEDGTPLRAAVRETTEELGISEADVTILGPLNHLISPVGVIMIPFVVYLAQTIILRPNPAEVEKVFTVPLAFLLTAKPVIGHMEMASRPLADFPYDLVPVGYSKDFKVRATYPVLFYRYGDHVIWGLTARVLAGFLDRCRQVLTTAGQQKKI